MNASAQKANSAIGVPARPAPAQHLLPLLSLSIAAGAFELVIGFLYPAIALNLEQRGTPADLIGYRRPRSASASR